MKAFLLSCVSIVWMNSFALTDLELRIVEGVRAVELRRMGYNVPPPVFVPPERHQLQEHLRQYMDRRWPIVDATQCMFVQEEPRTFSREMKYRKYVEQCYRCARCLNRFRFDEMEGDHIIPYSKGGKTDYLNLQMLCRRCNRQKGAR